MIAAHSATLNVNATTRFRAAEKNISPDQTNPNINTMSGIHCIATAGW